jgi:hypothetical protein
MANKLRKIETPKVKKLTEKSKPITTLRNTFPTIRKGDAGDFDLIKD